VKVTHFRMNTQDVMEVAASMSRFSASGGDLDLE